MVARRGGLVAAKRVFQWAVCLVFRSVVWKAGGWVVQKAAGKAGWTASSWVEKMAGSRAVEKAGWKVC